MKHPALYLPLLLFALAVLAGGNPEFVKFPEGYDTAFEHYTTMNRAGQEVAAKMYANDTAVASYRAGEDAAPGSVMVMEVYKPKRDGDGNPVTGPDGVYVPDSLAAVAVAERRAEWPDAFPENDRAGGWGFAIYNPDGTPKENQLPCSTCHTPLAQQDHLFTHQRLLDHLNSK